MLIFPCWAFSSLRFHRMHGVCVTRAINIILNRWNMTQKKSQTYYICIWNRKMVYNALLPFHVSKWWIFRCCRSFCHRAKTDKKKMQYFCLMDEQSAAKMIKSEHMRMCTGFIVDLNDRCHGYTVQLLFHIRLVAIFLLFPFLSGGPIVAANAFKFVWNHFWIV